MKFNTQILERNSAINVDSYLHKYNNEPLIRAKIWRK